MIFEVVSRLVGMFKAVFTSGGALSLNVDIPHHASSDLFQCDDGQLGYSGGKIMGSSRLISTALTCVTWQERYVYDVSRPWKFVII